MKGEWIFFTALILAIAVFISLPADALAFMSESEIKKGDLGWELYDVFMNRILGGPIGWVAVAVLIVMALFKMVQGNIQMTVIAFVVGLMIKAIPTIMNSLGVTLDIVYKNSAGVLIW
jgi:hypothetical protein